MPVWETPYNQNRAIQAEQASRMSDFDPWDFDPFKGLVYNPATLPPALSKMQKLHWRWRYLRKARRQ